jgi:hypothetical protein
MKETWYAALDVKTRLVGFDRSASSSRMYFVRLLLSELQILSSVHFCQNLLPNPTKARKNYIKTCIRSARQVTHANNEFQ